MAQRLFSDSDFVSEYDSIQAFKREKHGYKYDGIL